MHQFKSAKSIFATLALAAPLVANAIVTPIQGDFGNVFPTISQVNLDVSRTTAAAPWYVAFDLLAPANVAIGTQGLSGGYLGSAFSVTSIRLVTIEGDNVAFGTDVFINPFNLPITQLVSTTLGAGQYALEVSGTGNRTTFNCLPICGEVDTTDFATRLRVTPVPEPASYALMSIGIAATVVTARRRRRS